MLTHHISVLRRRRFRLPAQGDCGLFKSLQSRSVQQDNAELLHRERSLLACHGKLVTCLHSFQPDRSDEDDGTDTNVLAAMRQLIKAHENELRQYTNLDISTIQKVTYLHEFDREVQ